MKYCPYFYTCRCSIYCLFLFCCRYYDKNNKELTESLQPKYMFKVHGLRTRVVRSLFFLYPQFVDRVTRRVPFENSPDDLEGMQCVLMWHQKGKNNWYFYFKFHQPGGSSGTASMNSSPARRRFAQFDTDIGHNPEDRCRVLQVVMGNFISLPIVMGYSLHKTFLSVGHGMRYHKLKLVFTHQRLADTKVAMATGVSVIMDPVFNMRVFYWWDPKYPCNL